MPEQDAVEERIGAVAISLGFFVGNYNGCCYWTVSMQSHIRDKWKWNMDEQGKISEDILIEKLNCRNMGVLFCSKGGFCGITDRCLS